MTKIQAPFSPERVAALNRYQTRGKFHPFTCPNEHVGEAVLLATREGFVCPVEGCEYSQDWAHAFMAQEEE